jgi:hypothetical protein
LKPAVIHAIVTAATAARAAGHRSTYTYCATAADYPVVRDALTLALRRGPDELVCEPRPSGEPGQVEHHVWRFRGGGEVTLTWTNPLPGRQPKLDKGTVSAIAADLGVIDLGAVRAKKTQAEDAEFLADYRRRVIWCDVCRKTNKTHSDPQLRACIAVLRAKTNEPTPPAGA